MFPFCDYDMLIWSAITLAAEEVWAGRCTEAKSLFLPALQLVTDQPGCFSSPQSDAELSVRRWHLCYHPRCLHSSQGEHLSINLWIQVKEPVNSLVPSLREDKRNVFCVMSATVSGINFIFIFMWYREFDILLIYCAFVLCVIIFFEINLFLQLWWWWWKIPDVDIRKGKSQTHRFLWSLCCQTCKLKLQWLMSSWLFVSPELCSKAF